MHAKTPFVFNRREMEIERSPRRNRRLSINNMNVSKEFMCEKVAPATSNTT